MKLCVPEDCLSTDMEGCTCIINIKASLSGPFELPEDSELLSPVFWISALCKFKKPVTLEIQHCASRDEASYADLNFISTNCSQKTLRYTFKQLDGGRFSANSTYGSIELTHFSWFGITGRKRTPRTYCAQIYYAIKAPSDWRVYFIITKDLDALKSSVKQEYSDFAELETKFLVGFKQGSNKINLDIPEDGQVTENGWQILPHTNPTISKEDVDSFKPGKCVSKCELIVMWDPKQKDQKPERLLHKINLKGASEMCNYFHLKLDPAWSNKSDVLRHQSTSSGGSIEYSQEVARHQSTSSGGSVEYSLGLASKCPAGLHSEPKLLDLMNEVAAKIPGKWRDVGLQLGVDQSILEGTATISLGDTNLCYSKVFTRWKTQNSTMHPYIWSTIVQALKAPAVGEERLADKISAMLIGQRQL